MRLFHSRPDGTTSERQSETCTGTVWADAVMPSSDGFGLLWRKLYKRNTGTNCRLRRRQKHT